jgi:cephalosporin hydroxylase
MVILDADHSKEHVSKELALLAPQVTVGSYLSSRTRISTVIQHFRPTVKGRMRRAATVGLLDGFCRRQVSRKVPDDLQSERYLKRVART